MKDRYERYFYLTWQITCAEEFLLKGDNSNYNKFVLFINVNMFHFFYLDVIYLVALFR